MSSGMSLWRSLSLIFAVAVCLLGLVGIGSMGHAQADRVVTDLTGTWDSNIGMVYEISRAQSFGS